VDVGPPLTILARSHQLWEELVYECSNDLITPNTSCYPSRRPCDQTN